MGLDIVEFIMAVEERFGIEIPDGDAEKPATLRQLVDYIMTKVKPGTNPGCLTQREFYRLRRAAEPRTDLHLPSSFLHALSIRPRSIEVTRDRWKSGKPECRMEPGAAAFLILQSGPLTTNWEVQGARSDRTMRTCPTGLATCSPEISLGSTVGLV